MRKNHHYHRAMPAVLAFRHAVQAAVILSVATASPRLSAQLTTTTVQGTIYRADGSPASGTLLVSWPTFTTSGNQAVAAGTVSTTLGGAGFVSLKLTPNAGATPGGSYYTAVYHLSDGTVNTEYWVVPAAATASIASVRAQLEPATVAIQSVSQTYVDNAITNLAGFSLPLTGGAMTGPLMLSADPTAANQAATKHYADQAAAANLPLSGGTLIGPLSGPQLGQTFFAGRYANIGAAIAAAIDAGNAVVFDDNGSKGFTNASNVAVDFPDAQHRHGGLVFPEMDGAYGDGVHDDAAALQACANYSSAHPSKCELMPFAQYLISETLTLPTHSWVEGNSAANGSTIKCEVNGDCINIASGPVQGVHLSGLTLNCDPTLPESVGFHAVAVATLVDGVMQGGLWNSRIADMGISGCAQQGVEVVGSSGQAVNQFDFFTNVSVGGPTQSHPTPLWDFEGTNGQIILENDEANGDGAWATTADYPVLVKVVGSISSGSYPYTVRSTLFSIQNADGIGLQLSNTLDSSFVSTHFENITGWAIQTDHNQQFAFRDTHTAMTTQFLKSLGNDSGVVDNTEIAGGVLGDCSTNPASTSIRFTGEMEPGGLQSPSTPPITVGCATSQIVPATIIYLNTPTAIVNGDDCATPIQTIVSQVAPGDTFMLSNWSTTQTFCIGNSGNVSFGKTPAPFVVQPNQSVTFRRDDLGFGLVLVDPIPPGTTLQGGGGDTLAQDGIFPTTITGIRGCLGERQWNGAGTVGTPTAGYNSFGMCMGSTGPQCFYSSNTSIGAESWTAVPCGGELMATTGSIGGSALMAGNCASGAISISGATMSMDAHATPTTYPGDSFTWKAYVSSAGVVTVKVCTNLAAGGTPTASTYNVRVLR